MQILIYGAGGNAREVRWICEELRWTPVAFIADTPTDPVQGLPVLTLADGVMRYPDAALVNSIGQSRARQITTERAIAAGLRVVNVIHPSVRYSSRGVEIGSGVVMAAGCTLTTDLSIGDGAHLNLHCTVTHDCRLGRYVTLAPGVHISGNVHIGDRVWLGTGAVVINGTPDHPLTIADDCVIGAGAVVTRSITEPSTTAVGIPAKHR